MVHHLCCEHGCYLFVRKQTTMLTFLLCEPPSDALTYFFDLVPRINDVTTHTHTHEDASSFSKLLFHYLSRVDENANEQYHETPHAHATFSSGIETTTFQGLVSPHLLLHPAFCSLGPCSSRSTPWLPSQCVVNTAFLTQKTTFFHSLSLLPPTTPPHPLLTHSAYS